MLFFSVTDSDMDEGNSCNCPPPGDVHECAKCAMTFDTKFKLFDHIMLDHDADEADETDENNSAFSRGLEKDTQENRCHTWSHANWGKSIKKRLVM